MFRTIACTLITALSMAAQESPANCNAAAISPSVTVSLPASPSMATPSKDGCWVFVSLLDPELGGVVPEDPTNG